MNRKDFIKSLGVCGLIPFIPKWDAKGGKFRIWGIGHPKRGEGMVYGYYTTDGKQAEFFLVDYCKIAIPQKLENSKVPDKQTKEQQWCSHYLTGKICNSFEGEVKHHKKFATLPQSNLTLRKKIDKRIKEWYRRLA